MQGDFFLVSLTLNYCGIRLGDNMVMYTQSTVFGEIYKMMSTVTLS